MKFLILESRQIDLNCFSTFRLIYNSHGTLGSRTSSHGMLGGSCVTCFLLEGSGNLSSINVPFHCSLRWLQFTFRVKASSVSSVLILCLRNSPATICVFFRMALSSATLSTSCNRIKSPAVVRLQLVYTSSSFESNLGVISARPYKESV